MQKGTDHRPFDFFSFGILNQFAYLWDYYVASINWLKIDKNLTIKQNKTKTKRICYRSSRPEVFCKIGVLKNLAKFLGKHL